MIEDDSGAHTNTEDLYQTKRKRHQKAEEMKRIEVDDVASHQNTQKAADPSTGNSNNTQAHFLTNI